MSEFRNPFTELGRKRLQKPKGEEVEGTFVCQTCYAQSHEARYLEEISVLTWVCPNEHTNKVEDFSIE